MNHNPTSNEDAYLGLCLRASYDPALMEPANLQCLQQAAQKAVELHSMAQTATKHNQLFRAAAENANRCIATYFGNWRRSPQSFGKLVPQRMSSTLLELRKYAEKYQPSASKSKFLSFGKSSAGEIDNLNQDITRLHLEQPEDLRRPLELADFSKDTDIVTGIEAMRIDDSGPTTFSPSDTSVNPQADILPLPDHESKWNRHRSTVQSASDEDEPTDTAAARRSRSIREDSEDPHDDEPERQSSETRKRKTPKRRSKDSNDEEKASVDEEPSRKKKRPKKKVTRRYVDSSDLEDNSIRRSRTSESARPAPQPQPQPSQAGPQPERESHFLRMLNEATKNANGPVNINNMGNTYGGIYTYYTNTQPQSSSGR